mgnify:CR=1 FL=1
MVERLMVTALERFLGPTGQPGSLKGSPQEGSFPSYWINAEIIPPGSGMAKAQVSHACSSPSGLGGVVFETNLNPVF